MSTREFQAIFLGNTAWAGWVRIKTDEDDNKFYSIKKPFKWFPFIKFWIPILQGHEDLMMDYKEIEIYDIAGQSISQRRVRLYPFGLSDMCVVNNKNTNYENIRLIETLQARLTFQQNMTMDFRNFMEKNSNIDAIREFMLKEKKYWDEDMKPNAMYGMAQKIAEQGRKKGSA